jgi:hypothetical protein
VFRRIRHYRITSMPENKYMQWITILGIGILIYLLLRFRNTGTVAQISNCMIEPCRPNTCKPCASTVSFISDNTAICLASDYLPCAKVYTPAISKNNIRQTVCYSHVPSIAARCVGTSAPYPVKQSIPPYRVVVPHSPACLTRQNPCCVNSCLI